MHFRLGVVGTATAVVLATCVWTGAAAQSPSQAAESTRYESDYFAITLPAAWFVSDLAELGGDELPGFGWGAVDPDSGALCIASAFPRTKGGPEGALRGYATGLGENGLEYEMKEVDLSGGTAWVVTTEKEGLFYAMYGVELGPVNAYLDCNGPERPTGDWRPIAASLETLVPDDGLELGWPDVALTEQQTWARISPVMPIARRQVMHIFQTNTRDLPWYVVCKDRLHQRVPVGEDGWYDHLILRAIEAGNACWATRNVQSDDWDYSAWTTPEEATAERFQQMVEAGMEKQSRESFHWVCTYPGQERDPDYIYLTQDRNPPSMFDDFPDACDLVREPEVLVERPPTPTPAASAPPAAPREQVVRTGKGGGTTAPFRLAGTYRLDLTTTNCKRVELTLSDPEAGAVYTIPNGGAGSIVELDDRDYYWDVRATAKKGKKACKWTVALVPSPAGA